MRSSISKNRLMPRAAVHGRARQEAAGIARRRRARRPHSAG
ncbi:hypothetical protein BURMUCGD1_4273 [Burkholderia multivorans CGD1]|nr:hypothetical protein BURMUCGD1_4273 [Burkholderia multivorans CGD1]